MRTFELTRLAIGAFALLCSSVAFSQSCRVIEFAELNSMDHRELNSKMCEMTRNIDFLHKQTMLLISNNKLKESDELKERQRICQDEQFRIQMLLIKKSAGAEMLKCG